MSSEVLPPHAGPGSHAEAAVYDLQVSDFHWDRKAACFDSDRDKFYVRSRVLADPLNLTDQFCKQCPVAEDCLIETIRRQDTEVTIAAGMDRKTLLGLIRQYAHVRKEQAKENPNPAVHLGDVVEAIHNHIVALTSHAPLPSAHEGANTSHDPRWQEKYVKRSSIDPQRVHDFWTRHLNQEA